MNSEIIVVRKCPNCGEDVIFQDGDDMTICEHCETWLDIDSDNNYELIISGL